MDLPDGGEVAFKFITNVGLITSDGPLGPNIMSAEWTHHISYTPGLVAVCVRPNRTTYANIKKTKEFGISLCAVDQATLASVSGNYHGREFDKIEALKKIGFKFYKGTKIKALMVKDAAANIECRLVKSIPLGDHIMLVGESVESSANPNKEPIAYHQGRYWMMNTNAPKPSQKQREEIKKTVEGFKK